MPARYTESDIRDLKTFIRRQEIMSELQYRLVVEKHWEGKWISTNEKDNDGNLVKLINYEDILPIIIFAFQCYVTSEIERTLASIAGQDAGADEGEPGPAAGDNKAAV